MTAYLPFEPPTVVRTRRSLQVREKVRREGEERWKFALEGAGQGVWDWDIEHGQLSYSRLYASMLGYRLEGFDRDISAGFGRIHPDDLPRITAAIDAHLAGHTPFYRTDLRIRHRDGHYIWVESRGKLIERRPDGQPKRLIGVHIDITARKHTEACLQQSLAELERSQSVAHIGSWSRDLRDGSMRWSKETYRIFGLAPDSPLSFDLGLDLVHPEDAAAFRRAMERASREPGLHEITYRLVVEGRVKWVQEWFEYTLDEDGRPQALLGTIQDITQIKRVEDELREAKQLAESANEAKGVFLANMSHEIRSPLNAIVGYVDLLHRELTHPGHKRKLVNIRDSTHQLIGILNDILDQSKIDAGRLDLERRPFAVAGLLERLLRQFEDQARHRALVLAVDAPPAIRELVVCGDEMRLLQALANLLGNALKFTEAGEVRLGLACLERTAGTARLAFSVSDTGCGIDAAMHERIFEPFTQIDSTMTRRHGGTGLGLSISRDLIEAMGGRIRVDSGVGRGSTFRFELDLPLAAQAAAEPVPTRTAAHIPDFGGRRVLIVEDHPNSQEILLEMTEALGCVADVASDGSEALACALDQPRYDLILMDMQMPAMNGLEATRAIRRLPAYRTTPIIALTANAFSEDRRTCLDAGMSDHVGKPVTLTQLAGVLGEWLPCVRADTAPEAGGEPDGVAAPALHPQPGPAAPAQALHLRRFIDSGRADLARLQAHVDAGERAPAKALAHDLKGIAGLLGAHPVAALADEIGQALHAELDDAVIRYLAGKCAARLDELDAAQRADPA